MNKLQRRITQTGAAVGLAALCSGCAELALGYVAGTVLGNTLNGGGNVVSSHSLGNTPYSFAFTDWKDSNRNGIAELNLNEFQGTSSTYSLNNIENLYFQSQVNANFKGYAPKVWIKNQFGNFVFSKQGSAISDNLCCVGVSSTELKNSNVRGNCTIMFQLIKPNGEIFQEKAIDQYNLNFTE